MLGHQQVTENHSHFSSQRVTKTQIEITLITNLWWSSSDDTHRTSCYTIHVCVVWYSSYLYPKISVYIGALRSIMFCFQNMQWCCREPHEFTEILIINVDENTCVIHGNIETLLLNATAVSDLKKHGKSIIWVRRSEPKTAKINIRHVPKSKIAFRSSWTKSSKSYITGRRNLSN